MQAPQVPTPLPRRQLGKTGLEIPVIPFGTQGYGNNFGFVEDDEAIALIKHAISLGVNHFDCARCYGDSLRKTGLALNPNANRQKKRPTAASAKSLRQHRHKIVDNGLQGPSTQIIGSRR